MGPLPGALTRARARRHKLTSPDLERLRKIAVEGPPWSVDAYAVPATRVPERLHASNRLSVLMLFQAMDAAGKDGTIRAVLTGVNPASCQVKSFQAPTHLELDHDFMWRINQALPQRGNIGVFNRSHYEEVLTVRVHPEFLGPQRVTVPQSIDKLWEQRFRSIEKNQCCMAAHAYPSIGVRCHAMLMSSPRCMKPGLTVRYAHEHRCRQQRGCFQR